MVREVTWAMLMTASPAAAVETDAVSIAAAAASTSRDRKALSTFLNLHKAAEAVHRRRLELEAAGHPGVTAPVGGEGVGVGNEVMPQGASSNQLLQRAAELQLSAVEWQAALAKALSQSRRLLLLDSRHLLRFVQSCQEPIESARPGLVPGTTIPAVLVSQSRAKMQDMAAVLLPYVLMW